MQPEMGEDDHRATSVGESRDPTGEGERAAAAAAAAVAAAAAAMAAAAGAERANDTTSLGGVAGGAGQTEMEVSPTPVSEAGGESYPRIKNHNSKKRQRENVGDTPPSPGDPSSDRTKAGHGGAAVRGPGGHGEPAQQGMEWDGRPDTRKPLEDPNTDEVVTQDLATQEIRRLRRKTNAPPPPASAPSSSPPSSPQRPTDKGWGSSGNEGAVAKGGDAAKLPNGSKPSPEQLVNGKAGGERGEAEGGGEGGAANGGQPSAGGKANPGGDTSVPTAGEAGSGGGAGGKGDTEGGHGHAKHAAEGPNGVAFSKAAADTSSSEVVVASSSTASSAKSTSASPEQSRNGSAPAKLPCSPEPARLEGGAPGGGEGGGAAAAEAGQAGDEGAKREATLRATPEATLEAQTEAKAKKTPEAALEAEPAAKPEAKPETKPEAKPEAKPGAKPEAKPGAKPDAKLDAKPGAEPGAKPDAKLDAKPDAKPAVKPHGQADAQVGAKAGAKSDAQPGAKPDARPGVKPDAQPGAKPDARPGAKQDTQPGARQDAQPGAKLDAQPEPEPEPEAGQEAAPDAMPEMQPESNPEAMPQAQSVKKPEAQPEKMPGGQPETNPEAMDEDEEEEEEEERQAGDVEMKENTDQPKQQESEVVAAEPRSPCPEHALPVARTFFDFGTVSSFEMRMLPEFFTGRSASKTPEMYMQSRNYMVRTYQRMVESDRDRQAYLTATDCRRKLAGDACSTLRIHDFLDRFGLINTRTGGKRPPSYPIPPPSMHLWNPSPAVVYSSRPPLRESDAGQAAGAAAKPAAGGGAGRLGLGGMRATPSDETGSSDSSGREWHRNELVRLMEAAVATPDEWAAVAKQVGGGHTPAGCMQRFLNLAVEDVLGEKPDEQQPTAPSAPAPAATRPLPTAALPEAGSKGSAVGPAVVAAVGVEARGSAAVGTAASKPKAGDLTSQPGKASASRAPGPGSAASSSSAASSCKNAEGRATKSIKSAGKRTRPGVSDEAKRPAHLGQAAPAMMLASALVSSVHPEVLQAAMSAAVTSADGLAKRLVGASASGAAHRTRAARDGGRGSGSVSKTARGHCVAMAEGKGDGDVEMRHVDKPAAAGVQGDARKNLGPTANGLQGRAPSGTRAAAHAEGAGSLIEVERQASSAAAARAAVLSAAGLQARGLADLEEKRTETLVADLLEARVQRLEMKLHCFDELDQVLATERQSLEHDRAELMADKARSMMSK